MRNPIERPTVYGATYSTYVRTVRLVLEEKGVPYELIDIDVFAPGGAPAEYLKLNPFGRIPSFEHEGFFLYEAVAIARYIDDAFDGPSLQPRDIRERARMNQIIGILDSYAYRTLVWEIYVERNGAKSGKPPDEQRIASALPRARTCIDALCGLMAAGTWLAGSTLTLADLHAAPMFYYFLRTSEGKELMTHAPALTRWWNRIAQRTSVRATEPVQK